MTISTASIAAAIDETYGFDNLFPIAGSTRNLFWPGVADASTIWGRQVGKFNFNFEEAVYKFSNLSPTIPKNAKIISAVVRGTAEQTSTVATFLSVVRVLGKDGRWDPASSGPQWVSTSGIGFNFDADVHLFNAFLTTLVDTAQVATHTWPIRDNSASRSLKAGQGVDIVTGGSIVFADMTVVRLGAVAVGDVWCEIYSQDANGLGDVLLATSNTRPASTVPNALGDFRFTFSGGEILTVTAGEKYVVVLNGDYPVSASQNIALGWRSGGYAPGVFQIFGTGVSMDDQNYPMQKNFREIASPFGFGVWIAPRFFVGVSYDTPDNDSWAAGDTLTTMIQGYVNSPTYSQGDAFAVAIERSTFLFPSGTADRRFANFNHPTLAPVQLIVEWRDRAIRVS